MLVCTGSKTGLYPGVEDTANCMGGMGKWGWDRGRWGSGWSDSKWFKSDEYASLGVRGRLQLVIYIASHFRMA